MCGIAGIFAYDPRAGQVDRAELRAVRDAMRRRGPDGSGEWFSPDGRVGLAHRRLSIIDLSDAAAQPMVADGGTYAIVFNGEIYNFRELRAELEAEGRRFVTASDTEVLLELYRARGTAMLDRAARDVRVRALGSGATGACCSPATCTVSSRSTSPPAAGSCASPPRSRRCSRAGG